MTTDLIAIEQKEISFYGDELTAIRGSDGHIYAALRHMCESLGIDTQGQRQRIDRHTVLAKGLMVCKIHTIQGERDHHVLRADLVPLWLSGIRASTVNEDSRKKLEKFQEEAAAVLWEAFQNGRLTTDPTFDELLAQDTPEAQAYKLLQAMLQLARNQIILRNQIEDHELRLETIESQLSEPKHAVTQTQAMQISQAVKAVAVIYGRTTGRNEFGSVYGELYRKFEVTSYKLLPSSKFEEVMAWLSDWYQSLGGETPF